MKKSITFILGLLVTGISAQTQKTVMTDSYDRIQVEGSYTVKLIQAPEGKIVLNGDQEGVDNAVVECVNGTLRIYADKKRKSQDITVLVGVESLRAVSLTGSGKISNEALFKTPSFSASLGGSGSISLSLETDKAQAATTGSGNITLSGKTRSLECEVTGSGEIKANKMEATSVKARLSGSGNCKVLCNGPLHASIAGSGNIVYEGEAEIVKTEIAGSGNLRKA